MVLFCYDGHHCIRVREWPVANGGCWFCASNISPINACVRPTMVGRCSGLEFMVPGVIEEDDIEEQSWIWKSCVKTLEILLLFRLNFYYAS